MTVVTYPEKNRSQHLFFFGTIRELKVLLTPGPILIFPLPSSPPRPSSGLYWPPTIKLLQVKYFVSRVRQWLADSRADWRSNFQRPQRQRFTIIILWDIFTKEHIFIYEILMYKLIYNIFGLEIKAKTFTCIGDLPFYQYERRRIMIISTRTTSMSVNRFLVVDR